MASGKTQSKSRTLQRRGFFWFKATDLLKSVDQPPCPAPSFKAEDTAAQACGTLRSPEAWLMNINRDKKIRTGQ